MNTKRVALYARVSTKNNGQDPETQLIALREYAHHRGFEIMGEYSTGAGPVEAAYQSKKEVFIAKMTFVDIPWKIVFRFS
jgi:hypothetical protein